MLPVPTVFAVLATGFLFGVFVGSLVSIIGTTARSVCGVPPRPDSCPAWVAGKLASWGRLAALDRAVGEQGFKVVLLSRLSPIALLISLNYAFGLTQASLCANTPGALCIGGMPGTVLYVFFGAGLHSLHEVITYRQGQNHTAMAHRLFVWTSLITTVVVSVWLTRVARGTATAPGHAERVAEEEETIPRQDL